jgi:hypothetical protein
LWGSDHFFEPPADGVLDLVGVVGVDGVLDLVGVDAAAAAAAAAAASSASDAAAAADFELLDELPVRTAPLELLSLRGPGKATKRR